MQPEQWRQLNVAFSSRRDAEELAVRRIGPAFLDAEDRGLVRSWFFIRKPQWRFRWLPASPADAVTALRALTPAGPGMHWTPVVCEFETTAFGGPLGLSAACDLFHADSRHILQWLGGSQPLGRRETSVLLCGSLLRGAGLDWFEQGDVWARVAELRPRANPVPADPASLSQLRDAMRTLMTADARSLANPATGGPLSGRQSWITAFETAGQRLARLNEQGQLKRGLRAILAHHLIFHFNRIGISGGDQATMAALAVDVVFNSPDPPRRPSAGTGTDSRASSP